MVQVPKDTHERPALHRPGSPDAVEVERTWLDKDGHALPLEECSKEQLIDRFRKVVSTHYDRQKKWNETETTLQKKIKSHQKAKALANRRADAAIKSLRTLTEELSARSGAVKAILELVQYHVTDDDDRASLTTAISALKPAEPAPDARSGAVKVKALMCDFEDFINQPPQYEDQRMVRDYRHELYRKWEPLCRLILTAALEPAHPPESRLRDALVAKAKEAGLLSIEEINEVFAALAQGADK